MPGKLGQGRRKVWMPNKNVYRLCVDGKSGHASWWVGPMVWYRWTIAKDRNGFLCHTIFQLMSHQCKFINENRFECGQLNIIGNSFLGCQRTCRVYEISGGGLSCEIHQWDRVEQVFSLCESRLPIGVHSEQVTGPSQCCTIGDMLIDKRQFW